MITELNKEETAIAMNVSENQQVGDIINDIDAKLEIFRNLNTELPTLNYSLSLYTDDIRILLASLENKL